MLLKKQYQVLVFSFCFMVLSAVQGFSQEPKGTPIKSIGFTSSIASGFDGLNKEICFYLADIMKAKGLEVDWNSRYTLLVNAAYIPGDMIAINIVAMNSMPDTLLNFNIKNEVFYLNIAHKKKLPPEGKDVREYITRDYIKEYKRPGWGKWIICKRSDWKNGCNRFADDFMKDGWKSLE
jgi:hypothetical protein